MSNVPDNAPTPGEANLMQQVISTKASQTSYINFCRGALTPEEIVLDLGFNANAFGVKVLDENIEILNRVILSPATAKRLLFQLNEMVRRHEQNFGEVEMDFRRRLRVSPEGSAVPDPQANA